MDNELKEILNKIQSLLSRLEGKQNEITAIKSLLTDSQENNNKLLQKIEELEGGIRNCQMKLETANALVSTLTEEKADYRRRYENALENTIGKVALNVILDELWNRFIKSLKIKESNE